MLPALTVISVLLLLLCSLTLVRNDFWLFKVFEYPRLQKLILMGIVILAWIPVWQEMAGVHFVIFGLLAAFMVYYGSKVFPYTPLWPREIKRVSASVGDLDLKIFAANVLQDNREYKQLLAQIEATQPDIVFLLETDAGWEYAMRPLEAHFPYTLKRAQDNTYGLLFYSKLELVQGKVLTRVKPDIPSIEAVIALRGGQQVKIWGLHPEPPVPGENLYATAKDKELMKVALLAREEPLPCIVFGDLNDVAWSHTTMLFRKTSGLLDPRIGRGFYPTFSAHHWWVRFPLDYIFCSTDFGLAAMKRMPKNGSDHFATFVHFVYQPRLEKEQAAPEADAQDLKEAKEKAAQVVEE